jgi:hypothetical protein
MDYIRVHKEDGKSWWRIDNLEQWKDFTQLLATYEPVQYPCLVHEEVKYGYCLETSDFFVRYDV